MDRQGLVTCAIEHQSMQVNVQIGRRAKALDEGDGARGRFTAFDARLPDQMRRNDPVNDLQYRGEQFRVHREEAAQRDRERQHPLAHRHARDDAINQPSGGLRHAPRRGRGTNATPLAGKRH